MGEQRHVGDFADVDGLRALQAVIVLNVRWRIAKRSRPPQIKIPDMPLLLIDLAKIHNQLSSRAISSVLVSRRRCEIV
ncbi:MAG: hypothetical protein NT178_08030 [Proteobacteria bacterium]|nr:hypothetical protein [Pseudomonadota bacterium]